ncbi:ABC transporter permease [Kibdelosporangium lantanae]|uniref:ABC transporter permease n=1 Tax=Kibdelosporangium lantanae TaxID=1497396 RepID=A0ABW3M7F9_9PSEU
MTAAAVRPSLKLRLAERGVDLRLLLAVPAVLVILVLFVYPFVFGIQLSLTPQRFSNPLDNYRAFFSDPYYSSSLVNTLLIAVPATFVNVVAAVPIAVRMRRSFKGRRVLSAALVVPVSLGTVFLADGMLNVLGPSGWLNKLLMGIGLTDEPIRLTNNWWGVFLSLVVSGFPFAFLLMLAYASGIDPSLEQAAATLGASRGQRFRYVVFPLLLPGAAVTLCLNFVMAFSVFPSAVLLGDPSGSSRVMALIAYQEAQERLDPSMGSAVAMLLAAAQLVFVALVLGARSLLYRGPASGGKG